MAVVVVVGAVVAVEAAGAPGVLVAGVLVVEVDVDVAGAAVQVPGPPEARVVAVGEEA